MGGRRNSNGFWQRTIAMVIAVVTLAGVTAVAVDQTSNPAAAVSSNLTDSQEVLRAYQHVQEELQSMRQTIEVNRKDAEDIAARNVQALGDRLNLIEQSAASQRAVELQTLQSSNRLMYIVIGVLALLGFGIVLFAWLQRRALRRFTDVVQTFQLRAVAASTRIGPVVDANDPRLLNVLDRLEKRIRGLEQTNHLPLQAGEASANGKSTVILTDASEHKAAETMSPVAMGGEAEPGGQTAVLLSKGQSLSSVGQFEAAIGCFDEILSHEPANTDALIKKGMALEKLQKLDDAIVCYDRAIAADQTVTIAYLYKGGVYNRLERYNEALECYEKALQTQPSSAAA